MFYITRQSNSMLTVTFSKIFLEKKKFKHYGNIVTAPHAQPKLIDLLNI